MKYIPILFNTEMVQAILDGRKTQTRRLLKPKYRENEAGFQVITNKHNGQFVRVEYYDEYEETTRYMKHPCNPGDILWVRETWCPCASLDSFFDGKNLFVYKADYAEHSSLPCGWKPSIHMPREAARLFLKVKNVRLERLHDGFFKAGATILEVSKEGVNIGETCRECIEHYGQPCCVDLDDCTECGELDDSRYAFSKIWDNTITPDKLGCFGWSANPWVWVITFERCDKPEGW